MLDIEHMMHLFFDCTFAGGCWTQAGLHYDWSDVEFAPCWLLQKLSTATSEELVKICVVLWGIWHWRNKKVWDGKMVTPEFAMKHSFAMYTEWTEARQHSINESGTQTNIERVPGNPVSKWQKPAAATFKINVDA